MVTQTDHVFYLGEQHRRIGKPNQDYALSGVLESGLMYSIVSDGCSSGGMTDIGSRLMVLATKKALETLVLNQEFIRRDDAVMMINMHRDKYLKSYRKLLGLQFKDLLATCLYAVSSQDFVLLHMTGDGVISLRYENQLLIHHFEWDKNTLYYPIYGLSDQDEHFKQIHSENETPFSYVKSVVPLIDSSDESIDCFSAYNVVTGISGWTICLNAGGEDTNLSKLISVGLFSDGVDQVDGFSYLDVVKQLMDFKSVKGQFAVRRMNSFLKSARKNGKGPSDDISYAVIQFN